MMMMKSKHEGGDPEEEKTEKDAVEAIILRIAN